LSITSRNLGALGRPNHIAGPALLLWISRGISEVATLIYNRRKQTWLAAPDGLLAIYCMLSM
jgi:hypothetical protein